MPKQKPSTIKLQVFKGREAKLNKTIFHILSRKGASAVYTLLREIKKQRGFTDTRYGVVSRRVEALEKQDYLMKVGAIKTRWGYDTPLFSLTPRAELAIVISKTDLDRLIKEACELVDVGFEYVTGEYSDGGTDLRKLKDYMDKPQNGGDKPL